MTPKATEIAEETLSVRQRESERKRRRVLEAARASFGRGGFAGATIEAIAAEAGVSTGLIYQFFRNKEDLFRVVVDEVMRDWVRAMVGGAEAADTNAQRLEAMFRGSVDFARSHPLLPALLTGDSILQLERIDSASPKRVDAHREHVAGLLRAGIDAGEFRRDLDVPSVADVICQLQVDYSSRAYRRRPHYPSDPTLIDAAVRFIHDALVP